MANLRLNQIPIGSTIDHVIGLNAGVDTQVVGGAVLSGSSITCLVRSSSASSVTVSATADYFLALDPTLNTITVNLPSSPATGLTYLIKDATGKAGTNSITVTGANTIDGAATFVMNVNYMSIAVTFNGTQWSVS